MKKLFFILLGFIGLNSYTQSIMTIGEVFNFNINDEFHYRYFFDDLRPNAERYKIIDKSYSTNNDTIFYTIASDNYEAYIDYYPEPHLEYSFSTDTQTVYYTNLDSLVFDTLDFQNNPLVGYFDMYIGYRLCDTYVNGISYTYGGEFEPDYYSYFYGKGLGVVEESIALMGCPETPKEMFYYKKGNQICGTPDLTTGIKNNTILNSIDIYPNPTKDIINIKLFENFSFPIRFLIFDIKGIVIYSGKFDSFETIHDLSRLDTGLYFIKIKNRFTTICTTIIKE